jgi:CheY-like chemotaxis protein
VSESSEEASHSILVVDDDPMVLTFLSRVIARCGVSAVIASSAPEAIRALADNTHIKFVLTDIDMPFMSGIELRSVILQSDAWRQIPVALMTGGVSDGIPKGVLVLPKPFELKQIQCTLATYLGGPCPLGRLSSCSGSYRFHVATAPGAKPVYCVDCCENCPKRRYS